MKSSRVNPVHAASLFLYLVKTSRKLWLSDVFKGYRNRPLAWNGSTMTFLLYNNCRVKSVHIRSFSGPYFPAFGLNIEKCSVSLRIQSECTKIRTRKTPNIDTFYTVNKLCQRNFLISQFFFVNIFMFGCVFQVNLWSRFCIFTPFLLV